MIYNLFLFPVPLRHSSTGAKEHFSLGSGTFIENIYKYTIFKKNFNRFCLILDKFYPNCKKILHYHPIIKEIIDVLYLISYGELFDGPP